MADRGAQRPEGRRERKKAATRQALVDAAVELFAEQGFDETTVAQIAERADLSTRTFFLHFAAKDDVLLDELPVRTRFVLDILRAPEPDEDGVDVLARAFRAVTDTELPRESTLAWLRMRLAAADPSFQARMFAQREEAKASYAAALCEGFPNQFDEFGALITVSSASEAMYAGAMRAARRGGSVEEIEGAARDAVGIALWGRRSRR